MKKALLILPERYNFYKSINDSLEQMGYDVKRIDYLNIIKSSKSILGKIFSRIKYGKRKFEKIQLAVNAHYCDEFNKIKPDIVVVYNEQLLVPSTLELFKKSDVKIIFILGDNPLALAPTNIYNLSILFFADLIICPDSSWKLQLEKMGIKNIIFDYMFNINDSVSLEYDREEELLFIGRTYRGAWGYKRCLFLNHFNNLNIDIHGTGAHWNFWLDHFPKLKDKTIIHKNRLPLTKFNNLLLSYKIHPVDANPGISSGIHLRIFECLNAGILPLAEHTNDFDVVFTDTPLPTIKDFHECENMAVEYSKNNKERIKIVRDAREHLVENYSPIKVMKRVLDKV